ncbi:histidine phosphatase family protein [Rhizobium sp. SL86]|uniref:histidine phosphatase family protein n=1 Tax=Rhizobium sp. SL86 TaxID=2995148 RepID=UPI0022724375|nr:histidine phosphatase family protein [Rhizobium sp. SL86]MCY1664424.1 phosphoglycerate mutase family protein [Rhizobium sp. SL86]
MLIYMIRHGQTDWNAEGRLQGQKDIGLNDKGRAQARHNGATLRMLVGDDVGEFAFVASPLSRTRETMQIARQEMGLEPLDYQTDERLVELSFGDWEGHTLDEIRAISPERLKMRSRQKWAFIPPGSDAESYEILSWRVGAWLQSVDRPTVCVSHGGVIRSVLKLVGGWDELEAARCDIPQDRVLVIERDKDRADWFQV